MLEFAPHPLLHRAAFTATFPRSFESLETPPEVLDVLAPGALEATYDARLGLAALGEEDREALRQSARNLLRHGGHKPTGRGKPSSEYLVRASAGDGLPQINLGVDCCNAISLLSGLPISVIDMDRAQAPFRIAVAESGSYVFNESGQEIRLTGLLCLNDTKGPCANAVKDSHGTKTRSETRRTLTVLWAPADHAAHAERTIEAYMSLLADAGGAEVERIG